MIEQDRPVATQYLSENDFNKLVLSIDVRPSHDKPLRLDFPTKVFNNGQLAYLSSILVHDDLRHISINIPSEGLNIDQIEQLSKVITAAKQVTQISLQNAAEATCDAFESLAKALYKNNTVKTLNLKNFYNLYHASEALAILFKQNKSITKLDVSGCLLKDEQISNIADLLKDNTSLEILILTHNNITDAGATILISAPLPHLKHLHLGNNFLAVTDDLSGLCNAIIKNKTCQSINLSDSHWDKYAYNHFARCFWAKIQLKNYDEFFTLSLGDAGTTLSATFFLNLSPSIFYAQKEAGKLPLKQDPGMYVEHNFFLPHYNGSQAHEVSLEITEKIIAKLVHFNKNTPQFRTIQQEVSEFPEICLFVIKSLMQEIYSYYQSPKGNDDEKQVNEVKAENISYPMMLEDCDKDQNLSHSTALLGDRLLEFATMILQTYQHVPAEDKKSCEIRQSVEGSLMHQLPRLHGFVSRCRENEEFKNLIESYRPDLMRTIAHFKDFKTPAKRKSPSPINSIFAQSSRPDKKTKETPKDNGIDNQQQPTMQ